MDGSTDRLEVDAERPDPRVVAVFVAVQVVVPLLTWIDKMLTGASWHPWGWSMFSG